MSPDGTDPRDNKDQERRIERVYGPRKVGERDREGGPMTGTLGPEAEATEFWANHCRWCAHDRHDDRDDVRCGEIVGSDGGVMPEPRHCECLQWDDVLRMVARREAAAERRGRDELTVERLEKAWAMHVERRRHRMPFADDGCGPGCADDILAALRDTP